MQTSSGRTVDIDDFIHFMGTSLKGVPDKVINQRICSVLEGRVSGRFHYDFSNMYCGWRGISAIVSALAADLTFESLDLSGCGINNSGVKQLAELLTTHPVRITLLNYTYCIEVKTFLSEVQCVVVLPESLFFSKFGFLVEYLPVPNVLNEISPSYDQPRIPRSFSVSRSLEVSFALLCRLSVW